MGDSVKLDLYKIDGSKSQEKVELKDTVFGIEPNEHAVWQAVTAHMTNKRAGTAATKNRSAVRGGGRKPWRQKGRGTARVGTIRSPLWVGGGRIFGPQPHPFSKGLPKKVKMLARKSALSSKARDKKITAVEDFSFDAPKTKQMEGVLSALKLNGTKSLLLTGSHDRTVYLSGRNIPGLSVREAGNVSTYDIVNAEHILFQKSALSKLNEVLDK